MYRKSYESYAVDMLNYLEGIKASCCETMNLNLMQDVHKEIRAQAEKFRKRGVNIEYGWLGHEGKWFIPTDDDYKIHNILKPIEKN